MKKKRRRQVRADDQTNTPTSRTSGATRVAPRAARETTDPFLRRSSETEDVHKGLRDDVRQESWGVATAVSRTTFASRPLTKAGAAPGRMCDTGHDDPGLQPADLRRHTERKEINVIPIFPRSPCTERAWRGKVVPGWRTWSRCFFQNQCAVRCQRMSRGGNDPAYAREKDTRRRRCGKKTLNNTSGRGAKIAGRRIDLLLGKIAVTETPKRRADNERSVDLLLHAPGFGSTPKQTCQFVGARTRGC